MPVQNRIGPGDYDPLANSVKVMTMKVSKGLEFPVVAIPGVERMNAEANEPGEGAQALSEADTQARREAARVLYVAATRATQRLLLTVSGDSGSGRALRATHPDHLTKVLHP